jgi:phosphohistidine phosphatase
MKLYLMRHGAYTMDVEQQKDVLTETGRNDIIRMAAFLNQIPLRVTNILHSGKCRAQQTAELIAAGIVSQHAPQQHPGIHSEDDVSAFVNEITQWQDDVLVVGHQPFMGRLVAKLVVGNENKDCVDFQVGTLVCLEQIDESRWLIDWVLKPKLFV